MFFSSPPTASAGATGGQAHRQRRVAPRAADRQLVPVDERGPPSRRTARGSAGRGEPCVGDAPPAAAERRRRRKQIGSSVRLPLVITSTLRRPRPSETPGTGARAGGATAYRGASRRSAGSPVRRAPTTANRRARRASTIGRAGDASRLASPPSISASRRATARSRAITANGLSTRPFRSRNRRTGSSIDAAHAR